MYRSIGQASRGSLFWHSNVFIRESEISEAYGQGQWQLHSSPMAVGDMYFLSSNL